MKKYKVKFLTQSGIIEMIISETDNLELLQKEIHAKYGNFTTISSTELV